MKTYLSYPTKADQFESFKKFGDQVMNLGDAHDRGVLTGERSVRNLEHRLAKVFIQICLPMLGVIYRLEKIRLNAEVTIYFYPVIVLTKSTIVNLFHFFWG